ncbi:MAG: UDP-N-acetylmuramoyl-L-alanyl-D-glutamate--2,6-diaminopimelate ligase, partial [Lachnospiraceae bacterium]|nr:UDP-N-acetylmuramoyl-L-alanyl-D-glutamate--2,6-diaminopimelate ligase [Lachnospiraceae bacterium]
MRRLKGLLTNLEYECIKGTEDREVTDVIYDSRKVTKDCLFICIKGANVDGHDFAKQVVSNGAGALIVQNDVELPEDVDVTVIRVKDTRYAMAFISAAYFGNPADELK